MRVFIETEHENVKQTMELEDDITDVEEEEGLLRAYINIGDQAVNYACVELNKDELVTIYKKYAEVKDKIKTANELNSEEYESEDVSSEE